MKKGLVLGAAAMAAVAFAPVGADAGEVKLGGYYMFRAMNADTTITDANKNADDTNYYVHRLELSMDMMASDKTSAHMVTRVADSSTVAAANGRVQANHSTADGGDWDIRQLWLETELYGFGLKVGHMPISLNDNILVGQDTTSYGAVLLSKSFGDTTLLLSNVKLVENNTGGSSANNAATYGADDDDEDLYVISILGKAGSAHYQLTGAYWDASQDSVTANAITISANQDTSNTWLALTVGADLGGVDLTVTGIYEDGWDNVVATSQLAQDGYLLALRAKGKAGMGAWNMYGFYATEDFSNVITGRAAWSKTWDQGGPGGKDLMDSVTGHMLSGTTTTGTGVTTAANMTQNMWGLGAGLKLKAGAWTINPMIDYASVVEEDPDGNGVSNAAIDSMVGGSLLLSTKIDTGTTLFLEGAMVNPDWGQSHVTTTLDDEDMHYVQASIKMVF